MHYRLGYIVPMVLVAIISFYSAAPAHSEGCATRFYFCAGCDTSTTITVQSGKVCTVRYHNSGAIWRQRIVVQPHNGIYGTANETFGAYRANSGFVGDDSFQVDIEYEKTGQRFVTHLRANVHVHR
jgi:hypothetical protein